MTVHGHIENGNVIVDDTVALPEGAKVLIEIQYRAMPPRDPRGILKGLGPEVTEEDIAEVRKEMWANFPRDF